VSVALLVPITYRPFRGNNDPGLPQGIWTVQASVLGDAGGGNLNLDIVFKDGSLAVPESSLLYNLEQLSLFSSKDPGVDTTMNPANWDEVFGGSTGTTATVYRLSPGDLGALGGSALTFDQVEFRPLFLGQVRKNATNTIIRFQMANTAVSLSIKADGYYWGPQAMNSPGGPRRPLDSLYG